MTQVVIASKSSPFSKPSLTVIIKTGTAVTNNKTPRFLIQYLNFFI